MGRIIYGFAASMITIQAILFPAMADMPQDSLHSGEWVVLLHGLVRSKRSMAPLESYFKDAGYGVINQPYPSRKKSIQALAGQAIPEALDACRRQKAKKIHFVTHSMGGILVRYYLENQQIPELGRVVMISPPNHGSEVVDKLKDIHLFQWLNGPAGQQLGTDQSSIPLNLGPARCETGIITGDRSINLILSSMIPGEDDGKVSVESAKLDGMKDFLVVHRSHPFIMGDQTVCEQALAFIKNGKFNPL